VIGRRGVFRMLAKLKEMFGSRAGSVPARPWVARVNLERRFRIVAQTGQGSMSQVFRAVDNQTGATVCLKVQNPGKNAAAAARTNRTKPVEGEIALQVVHAHVVRTIEYGVSTRGEHFVVMEFIDGDNFQFLRETHAVPLLGDKLELLAQAAEGIAAVHAAGFIHHDVNPRNFLVGRDHVVKLIDFGLTVPNTAAFHRPGNRTGTLNYMAPELIRREPIDERIDVFAYGSVAFEFLTDRLPYDAASSMGSMIQRINSEPQDPARAHPGLPPELHQLLRKLTAKRKDDRWPRMATVAAALRAIPTPPSLPAG
jgi:eukaryotic-like serine/threonine-protein kinase